MKLRVEGPKRRRLTKRKRSTDDQLEIDWPPAQYRLPSLAELERLSLPVDVPEVSDHVAEASDETEAVPEFRRQGRRRRTGVAYPDPNT